MTRNLIPIMMGLVAMVLAFLSKIPVLKYIAIGVAGLLVVLGLFWVIGFILDKKNKNIKN